MPSRLMATPCAFNKAATSISNSITRTFTSTATVASPPREPPHPPRPTSSTSSLLSIDDRANASASAQNAFQPKGTVANRMMTRFKDKANSALREKQTQLDFLRNRKISDDYLKQMPRRWAAGDVYSPHDMSSVEMQKWRRRSGRRTDVIDALGIRPLDMYKNFSLIQEFTNSAGQISHPSVTQLRPVNQRKIAKMVRRIQGMGVYPTIHDHPELIRNEFFPEKGRR